MKRQDYVLFFVLIALLFAWPNVYKKFFGDQSLPAQAKPEQPLTETGAVKESSPVDPAIEPAVKPEPSITTASEKIVPTLADDESESQTEETFAVITNDSLRLVFSSRGAALIGATLVNYRESLPADSELVAFDFSDRSALAYDGIAGWSDKSDFAISASPEGDRISFERATDAGLAFRRDVSFGSNYMVIVRDTFVNQSDAEMSLGQHRIRTGAIPEESAHSDLAGMINMGVDALPPATGVENWGKDIPGQFKNQREEKELPSLPEEITFQPSPKGADWVAAKNKYFVQILMPEGEGADWIDIYASRQVTDAERAGARVKDAVVSSVAASLGFQNQNLVPGESYTRTYEYYVGPKNYTILSTLSYNRDGAMGFEENAYLDFLVVPAAKLLLRLLNFLYDHVYANYGVAIILLTLIVKIVFWPITHKGTESMRRMASIQPLMAEIKEKYKDNPQKMQQAMMGLYKEHKINPLGGCLPMLVQIPVFFALFVVLRIAIELRFAEFLWISDLSAPERIIEFGFTIPLLGWDALNILPLLMTVTMVIQQKLTPAAGDPQQQKIMMIMMPAMMLFFLYNFASGLALYWTTQNVLMIVQQLIYKQRKKHELVVTAKA
jgi:YidC/Oxa1 family membrane protein insertase